MAFKTMIETKPNQPVMYKPNMNIEYMYVVNNVPMFPASPLGSSDLFMMDTYNAERRNDC